MGSQSKRMVLNTRERVVSSDFNRLQSFLGADRAEFMRHWWLAQLAEENSGGFVTSIPSATSSPLAGTIINGIMAQPQIGSTDLFVTPGVGVVVDPELVPVSDDSPAHFMVEPGVTTPGTLSLAANASGSTRIDVIEGARVRSDRDGQGHLNSAAIIIETGSRDIYNPTTGLFSATTVNKVIQDGRYTYRIRQGTPGGGFPGTASGWMPLAVASVPTGTTTWDTVTLWDVRPLLADQKSSLVSRTQPVKRRFNATVGFQYDDNTGTAANRKFINGVIEWEYAGRAAGGILPASGLDLSTDDFAEPSFLASLTANSMWHLYAAFPFGLPRWARYSAAASGSRVPLGFRGIPIASSKNTNGYQRTPSSALTLPNNTGLGSTTSNAVAVWSSYSDNTNKLWPASSVDDGWVQIAQTSTKTQPSVTNQGLATSNILFTFDIVEGTNVPHGVREIEFDFTVNWTTGGATDANVALFAQVLQETFATYNFDTNREQQAGYRALVYIHTAGSSGVSAQINGARIILPPSYPGPNSPWTARTWRIGVLAGTAAAFSGLSAGTATAQITGFRL